MIPPALVDYLPPIPSWVPDVVAALAIGLGVIAALIALWGLHKGAKALTRKAKASKTTGADLLTWLAASIATIVSTQGMWQFLDGIIGDVHWSLRALMFAFLEVAVVTSAVRAKRNMRENYSAGIDGIAVWALTSLSAVLSAMEAASLPEGVFRLAAPLVAAWLWERGMAIERHRATGRKRIHWRITPERVLVRLGLAESRDRTAEEVDAQRRLTRVALAADRARTLRDSGASSRRQRRALTRMHHAYAAAHAHTELGRDETLQQTLAAEVASLRSAPDLLDVAPASAWTAPVPVEPSGFDRLAAETEQLRASVVDLGELRAMEANILTLAADLTGRSVTSRVTRPVTHAEVTPGVTKEVTDPPFFAPHEWLDEAADVTSDVTGDVTSERVTPEVTEKVTFDVTDPTLFDLRWPPLDLSDVTTIVTPDVTSDEVTEEVTDEVTSEVTATAAMRAHWDARIVDDEYPSVTELASVGGLGGHSHASRLRKEWVAELPWPKRRKANAKPKKAVNGSTR